MTWDPIARRTPVVIDLECSRDPETHVAAATITCTPWSTRERLAYQDRAMNAMKVDIVTSDDPTAEPVTLRRIIPSELTLTHVALTVTACTGFPPINGEPFDWTRRDHVEALGDPAILEEVAAHAVRVQPAPQNAVKKPDDRKAPTLPKGAATAETAADFDDGADDPDPSPAP